jgi:hypothetical protein
VHSVLFTGTMYSSFMHRPHHRRSNAAHDHPLSTTSALGRAGGVGLPTPASPPSFVAACALWTAALSWVQRTWIG